jgi:hypothetical protein
VPVNVGTIDQYIRIVVGLALVAFVLQDGLPIQGWYWAGLIGLMLLVTVFFRSWPALYHPWAFELYGSPIDRRLYVDRCGEIVKHCAVLYSVLLASNLGFI